MLENPCRSSSDVWSSAAQFTAFEPFRKIALSYVVKQEVIGYFLFGRHSGTTSRGVPARRDGRDARPPSFIGYLTSLTRYRSEKRTAVFVDVVISIGSDQNGADIGDPGNIGWHELLPGLSTSRSQVQLVDFGRHFPETIHE